jgi:hypothetical protein
MFELQSIYVSDMISPIDELDDFIERTFLAMNLLLERQLFNQALIIMYSAIDTMAWSCRDAGDADRNEFYAWCVRHMECDDLGITPLDLYAARCSMLHSNSVHSDSTESGTSLPLHYVFGPRSKPLQDYAPPTAQEWIVVDLEVLFDRFETATWEFRKRAMIIPTVRDVVSRRIERWLRFTTEE